MPSTIYLASDHGGFKLKKILVKYLQLLNHRVVDLGPVHLDPCDDYPQFAFLLGEKINQNPDSLGILLCRTGGGMVIAANKVKNIRAIFGASQEETVKGKATNLANVLVLAADYTSPEDAKKLCRVFIDTPFTVEKRHLQRIKQIKKYEESVFAKKQKTDKNI